MYVKKWKLKKNERLKEKYLNYCFFTGKFADLQIADWDTKEIRDLWINHHKFAGLRFADWNTTEICGFAIAE